MGLLGAQLSREEEKWDHHPEAQEEQHTRGEVKAMSHVTAGTLIEMSEINYKN